MKRFMLVFALLILVIGAGGYIAYQYAIDKVSEQIVTQLNDEILNDPDLLAELDEAVEAEEAADPAGTGEQAQSAETTEPETETDPAATNSNNNTNNNAQPQNDAQPKPSSTNDTKTAPATAGNSTDKMKFDSKQEAVNFVISRFKLSDINRFRKMAGDGLTAEEKQELKSIAYSKFTQAEIDAVRKAVSR